MEPAAGGDKVVLALRPEHVRIDRALVPGAVEGRIYSALPAGSETLVQAALNGTTIMAKLIGQEEYRLDQKVWMSIQTDRINVYDKASGRIMLAAST
jgi:multiple sugar transport system ATP-binding protein